MKRKFKFNSTRKAEMKTAGSEPRPWSAASTTLTTRPRRLFSAPVARVNLFTLTRACSARRTGRWRNIRTLSAKAREKWTQLTVKSHDDSLWMMKARSGWFIQLSEQLSRNLSSKTRRKKQKKQHKNSHEKQENTREFSSRREIRRTQPSLSSAREYPILSSHEIK